MRRSLTWNWRTLLLQQAVGAIVFLALISPMIIWNQRHGWPMLAHTMGHLGAGGDQIGRANRGNPLTWVLNVVGSLLGSIGPPLFILFASAWAAARRAKQANLAQWHDRLWLICATVPSVLFYVLLALTKPVVPSWPTPGTVPLVALVAAWLVEFRRWSTAPKWLATTCSGLVIYGVIGQLILFFPTPLRYLPIVGSKIEKATFKRFTGRRDEARSLSAVLGQVRTTDGQPPLLVARHYMEAGQLSFYLPGHPSVFTAGKYLGKRSTTYDQWPDTQLDNPALRGRTLLLIGDGDVPWEKALRFGDRKYLDAGNRFSVAFDYRGPQPDHPDNLKGDAE